MNNEQVMQLMADNGMHEGGMDNWVIDNAWFKFANLVAAQEREACAKVCEDMEEKAEGTECCKWPTPIDCAYAIRARGNT